MNQKLIFYVIIVSYSLFACSNNMILLDKDKREVGYECYYQDYQPDTVYLNKYIEMFSSFLPDEYLAARRNNRLEIFYGFHCYECPDEDKYGMFFSFTSHLNVKFVKVNATGVVMCVDSVEVDSTLFNSAKNIIGDFVLRDCQVEDGDESLLVLSQDEFTEILSYYKSVGHEGAIVDKTRKKINQLKLIRKILTISDECIFEQ
ncbi:MAG: hypothetical protein MI974_32505 [Chitinophagales bacterium]|nr:hypothetical protein [Chitinophagales bacterium]